MTTKSTAPRRKRERLDPHMLSEGEPTWEIAYLFPAQGKWTEKAYFELDGIYEGFPLVELSNGRLEVLPMPTQTHQFIAAVFYELLRTFTASHAPGVVLFTGLRVRLPEGEAAGYRYPDVVYMKAENAHRRHDKYWDGADLVMKVVSPDPEDRKRDLEVKAGEYARVLIPEYWIIDAEERQIKVLTLEGQTYKVHGDFGPGTVATSVLLPGFSVSVDEVLAAGSK
jgi:Uma2 family endonuclease